MNFEMTKEAMFHDHGHDIDFVRQPFNLLEAFLAFLAENKINELDVLSIVDRTTGEGVSYRLSKESLDKLFYRNEYPDYEETSSEDFKYVEHPVLNPNLIFKLVFGNFIDFQAFRQSTYDGGYLYWDFRYNQVIGKSHQSNTMEAYRWVREDGEDHSLEAELEKKPDTNPTYPSVNEVWAGSYTTHTKKED